MSESLRKTFKYKLKLTPEQECQLEEVLWRCRRLYNTALEQRIILYRQRGVSLTRYTQEAEIKDLRAAFPDCGTSLHRDYNAAKNIERLGQSLRGAVA
jgi:transposase